LRVGVRLRTPQQVYVHSCLHVNLFVLLSPRRDPEDRVRPQANVDGDGLVPLLRRRESMTRRHAMSRSTLQTAEDPHTVAELEDLAFELRSKLLELCGTYEGAVHIGGDLSAADILTALFEYGLNV